MKLQIIIFLAIFISLIACEIPKIQNEIHSSEYALLHKQFPNDNPGYGIVDYGDYPKGSVAKAYAMILKAEVNRVNKKLPIEGIQDLSKVAGEYLLAHADENNDGVYGWGVGLAWDAFGDGSVNPANTEYTISTAIVIDALLDWYEAGSLAPRKKILSIVKAASLPYLEDKVLSPSGLFPYSLAEDDRKYDVFNPAAYLAGQFQRLSHIVLDEKLSDKLQHFADLTVQAHLKAVQKDNKDNWYWGYSIQENHIPNDLAHAIYITDGLSKYEKYGGRFAKQIDALKINMHLAQFISPNEDYVLGWPIFREDIRTPARSYGIGIATYYVVTRPELKAFKRVLLNSRGLYQTVDGGYSKYPTQDIEDVYSVTKSSTLKVQEYQAYMLYGFSFQITSQK